MRIKVGDQVTYWRGSLLVDGRIKRIELAPETLVELEDPAAPAEVPALDLVPDSADFVDLDDGTWTYAGRIVVVNGVKV